MAKRPATPADPAPVEPVNPVAATDPPAADPPAADPAPPVVEPEDEFSKMFSQFSRPGGDPTDTLSPGNEPVPPTPPAADPAAPPAPAAAAPPVPPAPAPAPTPAPAAPPVPAPAAPADDPVARLADLLTQRQPAQTQDPQQQPQPFFNAEETAALRAYYTEWPDVARANDLVVRATAHMVRQEVYREMAGYLKPKLDLLDQLAGNFQYDVLERRIPEYTALQDKVIAWIGEQPSYLKDAFTGVMERGTPDQVEDLYSRYRAATGLETPPAPIAPAPGAPTAPSPPAATLSPAAIKAAARLEPVSSKRTAPATGAPQTFEDGFDAAVRELAQSG